MGVIAGLGAFVARVPTPSLRVDLESASYPAVVVGAVVPVLLGALAAAPPGPHLAWLLNGQDRRAAALRTAEFAAIAVVTSLSAAVAGAPAGVAGAAIQNGLVTLFIAVILGRVLGAGVAVALVTAAAVTALLTAGVAGSAWLPIDGVADPADWVVSASLAVPACVVVWRVR